ncbi:nucleoside triphosphate pyrophosphohydrolase [Candidatus Dependentiae bacterium]|nr:nucleoside triphosphate pyrophosphohydrolase [Candidatus Dependentiae bacterium]
MIIYNKLVRDKIPEIIENDGKKYEMKIVSNDEAKLLLAEKIKEEADEFLKDPSKEEMADILEVVLSMIKKSNWTFEEIEKIRIQKAEKRGGFEKNIFLVSTETR